jgi:hypothetical protein
VRRGVVEGDGVCGGGQSMATACVMVFGFAVKVDNRRFHWAQFCLVTLTSPGSCTMETVFGGGQSREPLPV